MNYRQYQRILKGTRVLRQPRHRLSTFGPSEIRYSLVSALSAAPPQAHVRAGMVKAERPHILTPDVFARQFEGFGEDEAAFEKWLKDHFQDAFRGLAYTFQNKLESTSVHHLDARELAKNIQRDLDERDVPRAAVIFAPEKGWQFSLMKFILDETAQSFPTNVRELDERGLFDPAASALNKRRVEIEELFARAKRDPGALKTLGRRLKELGLFEEYQDRFFSLVNP